jgi:hypothetical protein
MPALQNGALVLLTTVSAMTFMQSKVTGETKDETVFIAEEAPEYWRASKLIGVGVFNLQGEKIGSISEVLLDHGGVAKIAVIYTGGVLGIHRKIVGEAFDTLKWVSHEDAVRKTFNAPSDKRPILPLPVIPEKKPRADLISGYPDHAVTDLTKAQLKGAPDFRYSPSPRGRGNRKVYDQMPEPSRLWRDWLARRFDRIPALVGNGVDTARFSPAPDASDETLRTRLNLPRGAPVFLAVGGVEARKNTVRVLSVPSPLNDGPCRTPSHVPMI